MSGLPGQFHSAGSTLTATTVTYGPYGGTTATAGTLSTPLMFTGQYLDSESGLYYLRARYYDPATAQFLTRDPMVAQTMSPYAYVAGNPLNSVDPSGLACTPGTDVGCAGPVNPTPVHTYTATVYQRSWDCCGILMTSVSTTVTWTTDGTRILSESSYNSTTNHQECWDLGFGTLCGPGWHVNNQSTQLTAGGPGSSSATICSSADFTYGGIFDPTAGTTPYHNSYSNTITVHADGSYSASWSSHWDNSFFGWHEQDFTGYGTGG